MILCHLKGRPCIGAIQMPFETDNIKEKPSHDFSSLNSQIHLQLVHTFLVGKKTTLYLGARVANLKS
jgi:hypothetical protein